MNGGDLQIPVSISYWPDPRGRTLVPRLERRLAALQRGAGHDGICRYGMIHPRGPEHCMELSERWKEIRRCEGVLESVDGARSRRSQDDSGHMDQAA